LKIRRWKLGDTFQPLGMKGKKKLSDFMIDEKIPLNLKRNVLVLISGEDIVWVAGHRIDDKYKITSHTKKVFKIAMTYD
jgi:tRNA(Ile)-lysidine synthase